MGEVRTLSDYERLWTRHGIDIVFSYKGTLWAASVKLPILTHRHWGAGTNIRVAMITELSLIYALPLIVAPPLFSGQLASNFRFF